MLTRQARVLRYLIMFIIIYTTIEVFACSAVLVPPIQQWIAFSVFHPGPMVPIAHGPQPEAVRADVGEPGPDGVEIHQMSPVEPTGWLMALQGLE